MSPETVFELQKQVLEYCEDMGERFAILDAAARQSAADLSEREHRDSDPAMARSCTSLDGALYFPWVKVKSLSGSGEQWVPPCGHIAGIYARTDAQVGFHKAPANEIVEGVLDLQ